MCISAHFYATFFSTLCEVFIVLSLSNHLLDLSFFTGFLILFCTVYSASGSSLTYLFAVLI